MTKKTTTASEHTSIMPIRGNQVRLTADPGYLLCSKHTGKTAQSVITTHMAGYEVIKAEE